MKKAIKNYAAIILTAVLLALNYQLFIFDNAFAPAGVNGIATMIQYKMNISVAYMSLLVNIPLCILAFIFLDRGFALKSSIFTLVFSASLLLLRYRIIDLSSLSYHTDNGTSTILAPIAAGVINGCIYGMVVRAGGSTGGTDVIGALVHRVHPEKSMVWIIFGINSAVALVSYFIYDYNVEPVVLCLIYCFLSSRVGDLMMRGVRERVKFEIVTRDYVGMSQEIITKLKHSATVVPARGMYSGKQTHLLICVIQKHQIVELQKIIEKYPDSFAYVSGVNDTIGNYRNIHQNLLGNLFHGYWEED